MSLIKVPVRGSDDPGTPILIIIIIIIALIFDFTNGFHDSANSISTLFRQRFSPPQGSGLCCILQFYRCFAFGVAVASTISKIIQVDNVLTDVIPYIILAALLGAILWNLITWYFGLPTSSSHALIGGMTGAGISAAGLVAIKWSTVGLVATFMVISPIIGLSSVPVHGCCP